MDKGQPETGYFVLSDFSGFTAYLAGVELEHAQSVLRDLIEVLIDRLAPPLTVASLVGDGVLAYARAQNLPRGETLLEVVEAAYAAFRQRVSTIAHRTTCTCRACQAVPNLDLKFTVHSGEFRLQHVPAGQPQPELLGLEVDLVRQRRLKPPVSEATGWRGYALFTAAALEQMGLRPERLEAHKQTVSTDAGHEIVTYSLDLKSRFEAQQAAQRAFVSAEEADAVVVQDCGAPAAVVWEWLNDPGKRSQWMRGRLWRSGPRPNGRTDIGARNHCEHGLGRATETVLDWRPFDYFTVELAPGPGNASLVQTFRLEPLAGEAGTRVHSHTRIKYPLPRWLARPVCRVAVGGLLRSDLGRLAGLLAAKAG